MTDAAATNKLLFKTLVEKHGFTRLYHVTCLAHGLHRVCEKIMEHYKKVFRLIKKMKKLYKNATKRKQRWREINPSIKIFPTPILTRWGTSIAAAIYYATPQYASAVVKGLEDLIKNDKKAKKRATKILNLLNSKEVQEDLKFIKSNFECMLDEFKWLERRCSSTNIWQASLVLEDLRYKFVMAKVPDDIIKKFDYVFERNDGFDELSELARWNVKSERLQKYSEKELNFFLNHAPCTSSECERCFSMYNSMHSANRNRLTVENLNKHLIIKHYLNLEVYRDKKLKQSTRQLNK